VKQCHNGVCLCCVSELPHEKLISLHSQSWPLLVTLNLLPAQLLSRDP
jgi:hypothetical protein